MRPEVASRRHVDTRNGDGRPPLPCNAEHSLGGGVGAVAGARRPDAEPVSIASIFFGLAAGAYMVLGAELGGSWRLALFSLAALLILVRSLCNLWDGMMAIEGGLQSASGAIYNDLPDRLTALPRPHVGHA